jgi:hypothetical protein
MPFPLLALAVLVVAVEASPAPDRPSPSPPPSPPPPPCQTVDVATVDLVDSGTAKPGDAFRFKTVTDVPATTTHPFMPRDSIGYAVVVTAHHNGRQGKPGFMLVDARFVALSDGTHVPVEFFPDPKRVAAMLEGQSANAPGYLGFIPYAGIMTGAYNTIHYGREVVVKPGSRYTLVVGDELALGACSLQESSRQQAR